MSRESLLIKNTFILSVGVFLPRLIGFITLPILTAYLTMTEYGTYDLVTILATLLLPAATLQIQTAAFRFLIDNRNNGYEVKKIITNIYAFIFPVSGVALFVLFFVLRSISVYSRILIILYFAFDIFENAARQIVRGLSNNKAYSISAIISSFGKMLFALIFVLLLRKGLNGALICLVASSALSFTYLCIKGQILIYFDPQCINRETIKELIAYSWPMVPNSLSLWVISVSDRLLITMFLGIELNAVYAVANKIPSILALARSTFTMAWQESASISAKDKDADVYYSSMYDTVISAMTGCLAMLIAITPILFSVLIKGEYLVAYFQMPILFIATLLDSLSSFLGGIYVAYKKTKSVGVTTMAAATCNLLINFVLIKKIGLYAASLSTLISYLLLVIFRMINISTFVKIQYNYSKMIGCILIIVMMCIICFQQVFVLNLINCFIGVIVFFIFNKNMITIVLNKFNIKVNRK